MGKFIILKSVYYLVTLSLVVSSVSIGHSMEGGGLGSRANFKAEKDMNIEIDNSRAITASKNNILASKLKNLEDSGLMAIEFEIPAFDFDQKHFTIPGFLIRSKTIQKEKPITVFYIHGGPHSSVTGVDKDGESEMTSMMEMAAALNVQIVGFDYRGSVLSPFITNYKNFADSNEDRTSKWGHVGEKYQGDPEFAQNYLNVIKNDYGGEHMDDLVSVYHYIMDTYTDYVDPNKVIVAGHSFGGYSAALALMMPKTKKFFQGGVLLSGFYEIPLKYRDDLVASGESQGMRKLPINFVKEINAPVLIVHGTEDPNDFCKYDGATKFYQALRGANKKADLISLLGEGHADFKPESDAIIVKAFNKFITQIFPR